MSPYLYRENTENKSFHDSQISSSIQQMKRLKLLDKEFVFLKKKGLKMFYKM